MITPARVGVFLHRADNCATVSPSTAQQLNKEVKVGVVAVAKYQHGYSLLVTNIISSSVTKTLVMPLTKCAQFAGHRLVMVSCCSPLCHRVIVLPPPGTRTRASIVPPQSFSVSSPAGDKGTPPPLAAPTVTKRLATLALQRTYPRFCWPQIRAWPPPRPDKARISNLPSSRTDYISRPLGTLLMNAELARVTGQEFVVSEVFTP